MTPLLVGVDVGTTWLKALALTPAGVEVGSAREATPWRHRSGRTDADPRVLADLVVAACVAAVERAQQRTGGPVTVLALGFTGMAETGVLVDGAGRPCAPALAWHDSRADLDAVRVVVGADDFRRTTGMNLTSLPSLGKVTWLRRHVPGARDAVRHLSVGEWLVRCLGGDEVAELSLVSRTGMWDVVANRPWAAAEEVVGRSLLPRTVVPAGTAAGTVPADGPPALRGAVLTVAGHDHQAAALAAGAARPGVLFDSLGTAEALLRHVPAPPADGVQADGGLRASIAALAAAEVTVGRAVVPGHLCVLAGMHLGLTLERVCAVVGATSREARYALGAAALDALSDDRGSALRLSDADGAGLTISGITEDCTPPDLFAAAIRSLQADCDTMLRLTEAFAGPRTATVAAGGWLNNPAVSAAKRRQHPGLAATSLGEAGATGAALLAGIAAGVLARPGPDEPPRWADGSPTSALVPPPPVDSTSPAPDPSTPRRTHA